MLIQCLPLVQCVPPSSESTRGLPVTVAPISDVNDPQASSSNVTLQHLSNLMLQQRARREQTLQTRRERDRECRKKMREEEPEMHKEKLALRRRRERDSRLREREDHATARAHRLEKRRIREREKRTRETSAERSSRLLKRRQRERRRTGQAKVDEAANQEAAVGLESAHVTTSSSQDNANLADRTDSSNAQLLTSSSDSAESCPTGTRQPDSIAETFNTQDTQDTHGLILNFIQQVNSPRAVTQDQAEPIGLVHTDSHTNQL